MTLQELKNEYKKIFYMKDEDDAILEILIAIALSIHTRADAVWLLIIGPPSLGKTELVNLLSKVEHAHEISTVTENAFLSAMPGDNGKERSLLHKIGKKGLITMRDYTSILSLKEELRKKILGDMRQIYEGHLHKATGNGKDGDWTGKICFVGAVTDAIYINEGDDASMGRRTIDYVMPHVSQDTRIKMTKRASRNVADAQEKRDYLAQIFADFIKEHADKMTSTLPLIDEHIEDALIEVADFSTKMRTATKRDFKGNLSFAPGNEAPMRMNNQLQILAQMLMYINDGVLHDKHLAVLNKVALDSIPRQRRVVLQCMAKYDRVSTKGLAQEINYPTKTALNWLEDINVIGGCVRTVDGYRDMWIIKPEGRKLILQNDNIKYIGGDLIGDEGGDISDIEGLTDPGTLEEISRNASKSFDSFQNMF